MWAMERCPKKVVQGRGFFSVRYHFSTNRWGLLALPPSSACSLLQHWILDSLQPASSFPLLLFLCPTYLSLLHLLFPIFDLSPTSLVSMRRMESSSDKRKTHPFPSITTLPSSDHLYYLPNIPWNKGCVSSLCTCSLTRDAKCTTHTHREPSPLPAGHAAHSFNCVDPSLGFSP